MIFAECPCNIQDSIVSSNCHRRLIKMEMIPLAEARERQRRRLTQSLLRPSDPSVTDPLLASEVDIRSRRAPPLFGDKHVRYTGTYSSYQPPQPIGLDLESVQQEILDDYLFFDSPAPDRRLSLKRTPPLQRENPAVDIGGFFSYGCCCMQCVRTQEIGIIENFGQFQEILAPGFYCLVWPFSSIAGRLSLRVQQLDVVCETKTKDNGASGSLFVRAHHLRSDILFSMHCMRFMLDKKCLCICRCQCNTKCWWKKHTTRFIV